MEGIKLPEIKSEELLKALEEIPWENGHYFEFNGTQLVLIIATLDDLSNANSPGSLGDEAEFFESSSLDGFDIYLHDTIPEANRKRVLFHEILECNLLHQGVSREISHQIVLQEEERIFGKRT